MKHDYIVLAIISALLLMVLCWHEKKVSCWSEHLDIVASGESVTVLADGPAVAGHYAHPSLTMPGYVADAGPIPVQGEFNFLIESDAKAAGEPIKIRMMQVWNAYCLEDGHVSGLKSAKFRLVIDQ